jgi:hypothetical protein
MNQAEYDAETSRLESEEAARRKAVATRVEYDDWIVRSIRRLADNDHEAQEIHLGQYPKETPVVQRELHHRGIDAPDGMIERWAEIVGVRRVENTYLFTRRDCDRLVEDLLRPRLLAQHARRAVAAGCGWIDWARAQYPALYAEAPADAK